MKPVTIFKNFIEPIENKSLTLIHSDITSGMYKSQVGDIRKLVAEGKKEEANILKKRLPAFCLSQFAGGRTLANLTAYSGNIILDIDDLREEEMEPLFHKINSIPFTYSCFRSPGGRGFKIIVETNAKLLEHHGQAWSAVAVYYEKELQIKIDPSGKDITRLCFFSYDPSAFINENNERFIIKIRKDYMEWIDNLPTEPIAKETIEAGNSIETLFAQCVEFTNKKENFKNGSRNNFVYQLACNCNRSGISYTDALQMILKYYNYDNIEVQNSVKSAYTHHQSEFAEFAHASLNGQEHKEEFNELLSATPFIPDELFSSLPILLQDGCKAFTDKRERDLFLTGAITLISGCINSVEGCYDNRVVYANLNCFGIAPPGSGKGAFISVRDLGAEYHKKLKLESLDLLKEYKRELQQYKMNLKDNLECEEPIEPPFRMLYIPANSSSAAVLKALNDSGGQGVICETEADTLSATLRQDWGGYSDMIRKAFHHESISCYRKTNKEYVEIETPQLSVLLAGTPSQVLSLIASAEDGLFSRFIFYVYRSDFKWRDVSPNLERPNLTEYFNVLSEKVKSMIEFLELSPTKFDLTISQWQELNSFFTAKLSHTVTFISEDFSATSMRLGLIAFRIAMVLTAIRKFEDGVSDEAIICADNDFKTALTLADVYLQHATVMFRHLPKAGGSKLEPQKQKLFDALPDEFTRQEAVTIAKELKIAERTADKYLKQFLGKFLEHTEYGKYKKL